MLSEHEDAFQSMKEYQDRIDSYYRMSHEEFATLPQKKQITILFEMLREQAGEIRDIARFVREAEELVQKVKDLTAKLETPEGSKEIVDMMMSSVMRNLGGGFGFLGRGK